MKLSVIIPVYNGSKYIDNLIKMIKENQHLETEFIVVDDGSTDDSEELLISLSKGMERFRVIHKCNGGVSTARNLGIENACGEYIWFIDVDDAIVQGSIENICRLVESNKDLYLFDVNYMSNGKINKLESLENVNPFELEENANTYMLKNIMTTTRCNAVWNKVFKRELIMKNRIEFPVGITNGEDTVFLLNYYDKIRSMKYIKNIFYLYIIHPGSAANNIGPETLKSVIEYYKQKVEYCKKYHMKDIEDYVRQDFVNTVFRTLFHIKCNKKIKGNKKLKDCIEFTVEDNFIRSEYIKVGNNFDGELKLYYYLYIKKRVVMIYWLISFLAIGYSAKKVVVKLIRR